MVDILNGVGINWIYFKMETTQVLFLVQTDTDRVITERRSDSQIDTRVLWEKTTDILYFVFY